MPYKHGVYVSERATSLSVPVEGTAGLQVIFGTAPVNLADDPTNAVNKPKLCNTFSEAKAAVGYCDDFENYTLCQAIDANFRVFANAPIILVNVLDPATHKTVVAEAEMTLTDGRVVISASGEPVFGVIHSTIAVAATSGGTALVEGTDYTVSYDDAGYCTITNLGTQTKLYVAYSKLNPSAVTATDIIGSAATSSAAEKGLEIIRQIYPLFGMTPGLISAPGWSHKATVMAAMQEKCSCINGVFSCECVVDIPSDSSGATIYTDVYTAKATVGADSAHTIACWPMAKINGKKYYLSALISALMAYTDANNDDVPYRSPSNQSLPITELCIASGATVLLDQEQANEVNGYGVVTALDMRGFRAWGNNTAYYQTSITPDAKDRWIACRRMFTWWGNSIILNYFQRVDNPMNRRLIENIVDGENIRGNSFVARGYLAGARVEFLSSENPTADLLNGVIRFNIYLAPYVPAEVINFTLEFDTEALTASIVGGE